ncbi:MAG: hypothetical protein ABIA04_10395 [Pseudomonadota bacterium]
MNIWQKLLSQLSRLYLEAKPFPLFNLYLFSAKNDKHKNLHKKLLYLKIKKLLNPCYFILFSAQALIWYFYKLWKILFKLIFKKGIFIKKEYGTLIVTQAITIIKLNFFYHILPINYYRYKFYLKENKSLIHKYFYKSELPCFHDFINKNKKDLKETKEFIGNKYEFAKALKSINIPSVQTLDLVKKRSSISSFFRNRTVFCKPLVSSQSKDAFKLLYVAKTNQYEIHPINGNVIKEHVGIERYLNGLIKKQNMMIEPYLSDHPDLNDFSESQEISTLRIITFEFKDGEFKAIYLQLEIPAAKKHEINKRQLYKIYPLDLKSFEVDNKWRINSELKYNKDIIISQNLRKLISTAVDYCIKVHENLINLKSVAFDLALTDRGPIIIEANYNWNIELINDVNLLEGLINH